MKAGSDARIIVTITLSPLVAGFLLGAILAMSRVFVGDANLTEPVTIVTLVLSPFMGVFFGGIPALVCSLIAMSLSPASVLREYLIAGFVGCSICVLYVLLVSAITGTTFYLSPVVLVPIVFFTGFIGVLMRFILRETFRLRREAALNGILHDIRRGRSRRRHRTGV